MSDYKRFVSYLYCYDNGIKKNNIGYARIETYKGQCKITIHIKLLALAHTSHTVLNTYLFYRKGQESIGLPLCPLNVKKAVGECQAIISSDKVSGSEIPFSMIGGIIIPVSPSRLLGTEWDDIPIVPSAFRTEEEAKDCEKIAVAEIAEAKEEAPPAEIAESGETPQAEIAESTEVPLPTIDGTITNYLLIEPEYIRHLSPEYHSLKQNSFLLHGFESYRHLILAKWLVSSPTLSAAEKEKEPVEIEDLDIFYQLGVPGIYSNREKAIAAKFGFAEFKTTKDSAPKYGDFGYWLVPVSF